MSNESERDLKFWAEYFGCSEESLAEGRFEQAGHYLRYQWDPVGLRLVADVPRSYEINDSQTLLEIMRKHRERG